MGLSLPVGRRLLSLPAGRRLLSLLVGQRLLSLLVGQRLLSLPAYVALALPKAVGALEGRSLIIDYFSKCLYLLLFHAAFYGLAERQHH